MKLAYFPGCKISFYLNSYGRSFEAVMDKLGIDLVHLPFNCCGYPARSTDFDISVFSAIRNFALARKYDLDILTPCKCCLGQLRYAAYQWNENKLLRQTISAVLARENLSWDGKTQVSHLLSFLTHDIGMDRIQKKIKKKLPEKRIVAQYGCHALRPYAITRFDNPHAPRMFEDLLGLTGFIPLPWSKSTECCGSPIYKTHKKLSLDILHGKLKSASASGADYICTACSHCQMQYNTLAVQTYHQEYPVRPMLFTQILGAALGIREKN